MYNTHKKSADRWHHLSQLLGISSLSRLGVTHLLICLCNHLTWPSSTPISSSITASASSLLSPSLLLNWHDNSRNPYMFVFFPLCFCDCFWNDFWIGFWDHRLLLPRLSSHFVCLSAPGHSLFDHSVTPSPLPRPRSVRPFVMLQTLLFCVTTIHVALLGQQSDPLLCSKRALNSTPFNIGQRHYCSDGGSGVKGVFLPSPSLSSPF